jgi:hypothetical protein
MSVILERDEEVMTWGLSHGGYAFLPVNYSVLFALYVRYKVNCQFEKRINSKEVSVDLRFQLMQLQSI